MYQEHFGLHSDPFALGPNLRFLYRSRAHAETMAHLSYGLEQGEDLILIVGVIGTGKTLALQHLLAKVSRLFRQVLINVTSVDFTEFLKLVLHELEQAWPPGADRADVLCLLKERALSLYAEGQKILLVVDEAQNLDAATLEGIRLLSNLGQPDKQLFQIVLAGQPSLEALIDGPQLAQLRQRIRIHYRLELLTVKETGEYIAHRLSVAGCRDPIFTQAAIVRIHELSGGIPRLVNHLAGNALLSAFVSETKRVDVRQVAAEGMPESPPPVDESPKLDTVPATPARGASQASMVDDGIQESSAPTLHVPQEEHLSMQGVDPPAGRRPTTRRHPGSANPSRRFRIWALVWLIPLALVVLGILYLSKEDPSGEYPLVQVEQLLPLTGETDAAVPQAHVDVPALPAILDSPLDPPVEAGTAADPSVTPVLNEGEPVTTQATQDAASRKTSVASPKSAALSPPVIEAPLTDHSSREPNDSLRTSSHWLHVASFQDKNRAERYRSQLAEAGSSVEVRETSLDRRGRSELWLRVMVGPFESIASADSAAITLEERGLITFRRTMSD